MNLRINSTPSFEERGLDACWTPPSVVRALAHYEHLPQWIIDPACGSGQILGALAPLGHIVLGRDICDYGGPGTTIADYPTSTLHMGQDQGIVTNPPFRLAAPFLEKALADGTIYVAFLLRLNFLESMRRKLFFESNPPTRVWVSSRRFEMHREGWDGPRVSSNQTYAWFCWDRRAPYAGPQIGWFDHREFADA